MVALSCVRGRERKEGGGEREEVGEEHVKVSAHGTVGTNTARIWVQCHG